LVQPGSVGRGKMEMDILVPSQPTIVFGLVGIVTMRSRSLGRRVSECWL
jgi:hypothetical protein